MAAFGKILAYNWIAWTLVRFYPHAPIRATPQWRHMHMHMHMCMCALSFFDTSFWQMHVKWFQEGSLISSGPLKGQVGGGIPCAILAAVGITTFLM